jgi:hypothetical protein
VRVPRRAAGPSRRQRGAAQAGSVGAPRAQTVSMISLSSTSRAAACLPALLNRRLMR